MGDFNLAPWSFAMHRQDRRFSPLTRRSHAIFTWPAHWPGPKLPAPFAFLAIDHVYASADLKTVGSGALPRSSSDHFGLVSEIFR